MSGWAGSVGFHMGPRFQYLALLALCLGGTAFLEVRFDARVWRRPLLVIRALALPWLVFNLANEVAVFRGLWFYSASYTTGWTVPRRYPVEEMCFFVAIPICALLTFEAASAVYAGRVVPPWARNRSPIRLTPLAVSPIVPLRRRWSAAVVASTTLALAALVLLVAVIQDARTDPVVRAGLRHDYVLLVNRFDYNLPEYPIIVVFLAAFVLAVEFGWWRTDIFRMRAYWSTMAICLLFMIPVNGWLTKLSAPVVLYAQDEFSGFRPIWDIPLEDFGFGIALLTLVLMSWVRVIERNERSVKRRNELASAV